ncbi:MAG: MFS transporter [Sphingomonadaceae bacterium]
MLAEKWQRNLAALVLGQALNMVAFSFVFSFFPLYVQTLGVSGTEEAAQWSGMIIAATAISMAISQPIWGNLADRCGRKPMLMRSMLGGSVVLTLMGMVQSPEQLLAMRFVQGLVSGTVAAGNALVAASVPRQRLGFALGLMQVAFFFGTSVGPLLGGVMADLWGFRVPFFAAGAMLAIGLLVVTIFVREEFTPPSSAASRAGVWTQSRALLAMPVIPILLSVLLLIQLGNVIVSPVLSLFIAELNASEKAGTAAGVVLGATGAASAVSALALGRLGDRIGHAVILPVCLVGAAVTYFPQGMVQQVWQLLLLRGLLGLFLGGLMPSANALLAGAVPRERRGAAFGLSSAAQAMANFVGPLSGAAITTHLGLRSIFAITGALYILAYGWVIAGFRRSPMPAPASRIEVAGSSHVPADVPADAGTPPSKGVE